MDTQEACFGGSGSDKEERETGCFTVQYTDDDGIDEDENEDDLNSDDDSESIKQKMNESVQLLNEIDRLKHLKANGGTDPTHKKHVLTQQLASWQA